MRSLWNILNYIFKQGGRPYRRPHSRPEDSKGDARERKNMFIVGDQITWTLTDSFSDALEIANIFKALHCPVYIKDAITDNLIYTT